MALFNVAEYAVDVYGEAPRKKDSAAPLSALALDYETIRVRWTQPAGLAEYAKIRLVRGLDGFPETAEDGAVIWEWDKDGDTAKITEFIDGLVDPVLPKGRFIYYRIWILSLTNVWSIAGDTFTLLPTIHAEYAPDKSTLTDTHAKFIDTLPRVFTSASESPIDSANDDSDLSRFLSAFSFTLDVILTYADLLLPNQGGRFTSPDVLLLQILELGLAPEPFLATKQQRRLAREILYIYQNKGTLIGVADFVESLTGFAPDVSMSPNLVLSTQDSSFTASLGFWRPVGDCTLELNTTTPGVVNTVEPYVDDYRFTAKVTAGPVTPGLEGSRIVNGNDYPITKGTPVKGGTAYRFSGYGKAETGTMYLGGHITWYNYRGEEIKVDPPRTYPPIYKPVTDADWEKFEILTRAPGLVQEVTSVSVTSNVATLTVSPYNVMVEGETIQIKGVTESGFTGLNRYFQVKEVGAFGENWIKVDFTHADTAAPVLLSGVTLIDCIPDVTDNNYLVMAANVTSNVVTLALVEVIEGTPTPSIAGLTVGDLIVFQGIDDALSFGLHTIVAIDDTAKTVSFVLSASHPHDDATYSFTGTPYGFAKEIVPNTGTPYEEATYASFELVFNSEGVVFLDLLQMATIETEFYHEARAAEIFLNPSKSNYLKNPGFHPDGMSEWTIVAAANSQPDRTEAPFNLTQFSSVSGKKGNVLEVDTTVAGPTVISASTTALTDGKGVPTGEFYTASIYAKLDSTEATDYEAFELVITAVDISTGTPVTIATKAEPMVVFNNWARYSATVFVPETTTAAVSTVGVIMTIQGLTTGQTVFFDRSQIETQFKPTDYFDGSFPISYGAVWEGDEYLSHSHLYPNLPIKITRLRKELPNYLPLNTSFLIRWYDGDKTFGGIAKPIV